MGDFLKSFLTLKGGVDGLIAAALAFGIHYYIVTMNGLELSPLGAAGIGAVIAFGIRLVRYAFFEGKKDTEDEE
ncbi:MAG: hypothetical protein R8L07_05495 [Alphaproteobacteria bacterium]|nr:hypothetical protein [Alphaproteobacteria bacterium]